MTSNGTSRGVFDRRRATISAASVGLACALLIPTASAQDDQAACIASHESAQKLRQRGQLLQAKRELESCSRSACPGLIATDCASWWEQVQGQIPSLLVELKTAGALVKLDGTALDVASLHGDIAVDPGEHTITATLDGHEPFEQRVNLAQGEKGVAVSIELRSLQTKVDKGDEPDTNDTASGPSMWTWIIGGIGVAGLATFGGFAISGMVRRGDLEDSSCKPYCAESDTDAMSRDFLIADIALGVGVAALGVATILLFTTDDGGAAVSASINPLPGPAQLRASVTF